MAKLSEKGIYPKHEKTATPQFATRLGVLATTVGSAVGLGNIWRFPYEAGTHGGGAFLICYLFFIFVIGVPLMCSEFAMGRSTRNNITGAYRTLSNTKSWTWLGYLGIVASLMILSFYSVVAGWTLEYSAQSVTGGLKLATQAEYHAKFDVFSTSNVRPVLWTLLFLLVNLVILIRGVSQGIEKMSNALMPLLFLILVAFAINSLLLPGAKEGLEFLFYPDFSKINSSVILGAMGQAFFSLSLGLGCMITYSSYFQSDTKLVKTAFTIASLDSLVAFLAGIIIFPAVFSYGGTPEAGPTLVFEVLPTIFHKMPGGVLWSSLFFLLLFLASLTSTVSMAEISIAFFVQETKLNRKTATCLTIGIAIIFGTLCALSFGALSNFTIAGLTIFNLFDFVSSSILLPIGGFALAIFTGYVMQKSILRNELTNYGTLSATQAKLIIGCIKYICPAAIFLVFLDTIGVI